MWIREFRRVKMYLADHLKHIPKTMARRKELISLKDNQGGMLIRLPQY